MTGNERLALLLFRICEPLDQWLHTRGWSCVPFRHTVCCLADISYGVPAYCDDPWLARWAAKHGGRGLMEHPGS